MTSSARVAIASPERFTKWGPREAIKTNKINKTSTSFINMVHATLLRRPYVYASPQATKWGPQRGQIIRLVMG